jgi:uroporphyrinogen-III decarboxylase
LQHVKSLTPAKVWYHTCGSVVQLIPDLIDNGIDILNPVQLSAANMDLAELKARFGDALVFWGGGIDTQQTIAFGTPAEVYDEARERIRVFNEGGGFVFNSVHNIQGNTPTENVVAMFNAIRDSRG